MEEKPKSKKFNILDWPLFMRVMRLARPYKRVFYLSTFLAISMAVLIPLQPFLIQISIDDFVMSNDAQGLTNMIMLLVGILMLTALIRYYFIYLTSWLGQSIIRNLRKDVFKHVLGLNLKYFDRTPIGISTTRTINDIETINDIFSQGIITIIADLLTLVVVIVFMLSQDWRLTLFSLSTFPLLLIATYVFKEKIKIAFQIVRTQVALLNAFLQEHITGMNVIQIFNAEEREYQKFTEINKEHRRAHINTIWYYSIFFPVVEIILASSIGIMIWWGAHKMLSNFTSVGELIAFILYIYMLFRPVRLLADKFNTLQMGMVAAERVFNLLDNDKRIEDSGTNKVLNLRGHIQFENVTFAYEDDNYVLKDISFVLEAGKTLAIVGSTGSGKTSIINILSRFYEIQKGRILVDGTDIKEYDLKSYRSNIGLVLQDIFLFSGSVMDNITMHNEDISTEKVMEASHEVGAHAFIKRLPGEYDFNVMERGATLSVGQRQLISFIRALVFDPKILILDEATSSVDAESEHMIQNAIEKLVANRTAIVIAHRLSTIQRADKILVLDQGEIQEMGTHIELLELDGAYRQLYEMQFKKAI